MIATRHATTLNVRTLSPLIAPLFQKGLKFGGKTEGAQSRKVLMIVECRVLVAV